ncbi:NAD(P)-binding protein [Calocera cornea HHB12733]|uniref:NAD(P)-binding protein n=1 Tax=Calocera cornea HHB12733 TaxID=1353952 RepID=A0A165FH57_9BASI|nr:NAD(P)-binding protein [Calocera cornea HHB12733]
MFPSAPEWSFADMPDLSGRVALVTGGNAGIGKVMCRELLRHGARVYMLCRSPSKAAAAVAELQSQLPASSAARITSLACDLSALPSVHSAARLLLAHEPALHLLFCNAGLFMCPREDLTEQGYDMQFGVNLLAHAYLIRLLLPAMQRTAVNAPQGAVRVVITSSSGANFAPPEGIDYVTLKDSAARTKRYNPYAAYYQSKWANVAYTHGLAAHYPLAAHRVLFVANDPGFIRTQIWDWQDPLRRWLRGMVLYDAEHGALTPLYAGTAPGVRQGGVYVPWAKEGRSRDDTLRSDLQDKLWNWVEQELGGLPGL